MPLPNDRKRLVSLFAGIGGFDLGFERAGFTPVGMCEIDPHARSVLDHHWPNVPKHDDVATLRGSAFGPADVVTFGSPCQDLSVAGKRAGLEGERSGLFLEAMRYIREMLEETNGQYPRAAVWENVVGAFSSNGGQDFAAVLESMVGGEVRRPTNGWAYAGVAFGPEGAAEWRVLDSQHFGVAQRRRRVFVIYHPGGERAGQVLLERQSLRGNPQTSRTPGQSPAGGPETRARDNSGAIGLSGELNAAHKLMPTLVRDSPTGGGQKPMVAQCLTTGTGQRYDPETETLITAPVAFALRGREEGAVPEVTGDQASALRGAPGAGHPDRGIAERAALGANEGGDASRGEPRTAYAVRRLTPRCFRECERLQGFPDGHTKFAAADTEIADTNRYRMLGNAVTVPVAEWIGTRINAVRSQA